MSQRHTASFILTCPYCGAAQPPGTIKCVECNREIPKSSSVSSPVTLDTAPTATLTRAHTDQGTFTVKVIHELLDLLLFPLPPDKRTPFKNLTRLLPRILSDPAYRYEKYLIRYIKFLAEQSKRLGKLELCTDYIVREEFYPMRLPPYMDRVSMEEIYEAVKAEVQRNELPVEVRLVKAYWRGDETHKRDRVAASLGGDHVWSDLKVVVGLDYMGSWANLSFYLLLQPTPEIIPAPREPFTGQRQAYKPFARALVSLAAASLLGIGAFTVLYSAVDWWTLRLGWTLELATLASLGITLFYLIKFYIEDSEYRKQRAAHKAEQDRIYLSQQAREQARRTKIAKLIIRNFGHEDMMLFQKFMGQVMAEVVLQLLVSKGAQLLESVSRQAKVVEDEKMIAAPSSFAGLL